MPDVEPILAPQKFQEALVFANLLHSQQLRKGTQIPYIAHLLGVAALVLEEGGGEDEAIAALLHDAVEDQGGWDTLCEIERRFGRNVAEIVEACTDAFTSPKPPWRLRKEAYLEHLKSASASVRIVSLADKLHNARSILASFWKEGEKTWERFNGGKDGTLWYYKQLVDIYTRTGKDYMTTELARVVAEIEEIANPE